jgi:D-lyxose ketol-isomerase
MKRSEINSALKEMEAMLTSLRIALPPFCHITPAQWQRKGSDYDEVRENQLGWDITDYGLGRFHEVGFSLITLRNGNHARQEKYPKPYAEKLLYLREGQYAPMHFHWNKMEDIINRGGGNVLICVYNSTAQEALDKKGDVVLHIDGRELVVPAGTQVRLAPGESITVAPYLYHDFSVEMGTGSVMLGEVSACNDDKSDNRFLEPIGRFPEIENDEPPYRLLCTEYPPAPTQN